VKPFLALEWLRPGKGEGAAALRLLARIPDLYGSRFFDILLLDALYTQAHVLDLFASRPPDSRFSEQREGKTSEVQLWDTEALLFSSTIHPDSCRALRRAAHAQSLSRGRTGAHTTEQEWMWATTFPIAFWRQLA